MTFTETYVHGIPEHYMPGRRKKKSRKRSKNKSKKWVRYQTKPKTTKPRRETAQSVHEKTVQKRDHIDGLHCIDVCSCVDCKVQFENYYAALNKWVFKCWIAEEEERKRKRDAENEMYWRLWEEEAELNESKKDKRRQCWIDEDEY